MLPRNLRVQWLLLGVASLVVLLGGALAQISSAPLSREITLAPGETLSFRAFRVFPDAASISLRFRREPWAPRPELGSYATKSGPGYIDFDSPGERVIMRIAGESASAIRVAMPADGYSADEVARHMISAQAQQSANRFLWPPGLDEVPVPAGGSILTITVLEVGPKLLGERVRVVLRPPLEFKFRRSDWYGALWWFSFWPMLAAPLLMYAAALTWRTARTRDLRGASEA